MFAVTAALVSAAALIFVGFGVVFGLAGGGGFFPQLKFSEMTQAKAAVIVTGMAKDDFFMWRIFLASAPNRSMMLTGAGNSS